MPGSPLLRPTRMLWIAVCAALVGIATMPYHAQAQEQAVESAPSPSTLGPASAPTSSPEPIRHRRHHKSDSSSTDSVPTPVPSSSVAPSASFANFGGTWEIQLQPGHSTVYSHFFFDAGSAAALTGKYIVSKLVEYPLTGQVDGDRFRIISTDAKGPFVMTGYEENSANLVGIMQQGNTRTSFTATHESGIAGPKVAGTGKHEHHRHHKHDAADEPTPAPTSTGSNG